MLHLQTGNGGRLDIPDMSAPSEATGRFRLPSGGPGHTLFKIVSSARGYHAWAWQSFGTFLFLWHELPGETDLWIATRSKEWKPLRAIPFLLPEMPIRACPHKRLDKKASEKERKKKGGKKNV